MSIADGVTEFIPKNKFKFSHKGQFVDCDYILLKEPKAEHARHYLKLRQMIKKAEVDTAIWAQKNLQQFMGQDNNESEFGEALVPFHEEVKEEDSADDTAKKVEGIITAIEQSDRTDLFDFIELFSKMVCANSNVALAVCNGLERFKQSNWDKMSPDDQIDMAAHWCCFFVTPSERGQNVTEQPSDFALKAVEG